MKAHSLFSNIGTFVLGLALLSSPFVSIANTYYQDDEDTEDNLVCSTLTINSDGNAKTAGYHESVPGLSNSSQGLNPSNYSAGALTDTAKVTTTVIPPWIDPATNSNFTGSKWISTDTSNNEGDPTLNQWRLFSESFILPIGAVVSSATLTYTADNAADVHLNGNTTPISSTGGTYGTPATTPNNFENVFTTNFTPIVGENTLSFVTRNWGGEYEENPAGLLFKATVEYCVSSENEDPEDGVVQIHKFIGNYHATTENVDGASFPMITPTYGNAPFTLSSTGWNTGDDAYEASTNEIMGGNTYTAYEDTNTGLVGVTCADSKPYALHGYSHGATLELAVAAPKTLTAPILTVDGDQHLIVWNTDCSSDDGELDGEVVSDDGELIVTSIEMIDTTATANGSFASGWKYAFHITAPMSETELSMKFNDWLRNGGGGTIPVASNMRISSSQANNGGATVLLTAANLYSTPALTMNADLDAGLVGRQVIIMVEVAIPNGTPNGSYNTSYGVQSN